jgi:hypothetical protein
MIFDLFTEQRIGRMHFAPMANTRLKNQDQLALDEVSRVSAIAR